MRRQDSTYFRTATPMLCPQCECLLDDHFNPFESDDPLIISQVMRETSPLNCCGDCADCDYYGYIEEVR